MKLQLALVVCVFFAAAAGGHEAANPLFDAARQLLENSLAGQDGGAGQGLLQGLAGALAGGKDGGGAAELLGSFLAAAGGQGGQGGGPDLLGVVADLFSQQAAGGGGQGQQEQGFDWENVIGAATSFMASQAGGHTSEDDHTGHNEGAEGLLTLLPLFMGGGKGSNVAQIWKTVTSAFNHFRHSEAALALWHSSGMSKITERFQDPEGNFDVHRVFESLSNHQFRRTWIRTLTSFMAEWLSHFADPSAQARYASIARGLLDGAMRSHGLASFDPTRPGKSLATLANAMLRKHVGATTDATPYVKPAVDYLWELLQIGRSTSAGLGLAAMPPRQIEGRMAEALNSEVIEPVLRVWRAYRFAHQETRCGRYVLCQAAKEARQMPGVGLKPAVTKVASLVATWYLADDVHSSFWDLYAAANSSSDCEDVFQKGCDEFLVVDKKATTKKYVHNEL